MEVAQPQVAFDFTDLEQILKEIRGLFNSSSEPQDLKQLAVAFSQAREKPKQALALGSQTLQARLEGSGESELAERAKELDRLDIICKQIEHDLQQLHNEYSSSASQQADLEAEIQELEKMLGDKEHIFIQFGGEAKFRQVCKLGNSAATASAPPSAAATNNFPQLRRILALFYNVTQIQWDLTCDEEETCGRVVNSEQGVIKQFRFGPMDEFELANRIWNTIG